MLYLFATAVGLSMDAFAVSVALGETYKKHIARKALTSSLIFGSFHTFAPLFGWLLGDMFKYFVINIDHWIAFILLAVIGLKSIVESEVTEGREKMVELIGLRQILYLAIATSIDALAVGVGLAFLGTHLFQTVGVIGIIALLFSLLGVYVGTVFKNKLGRKAEVIGGLTLLGIGIKILIDHLLL
ncbi:MAG: manganese efflux pump MntP family protein [Patescibacteria group bacterium]|jgi:putative Mn2+ efflux pump MntP